MSVSATTYDSFALCTDGTLAWWGGTSYLGYGNGTTSKVPVAVPTATLRAGETFMRVNTGLGAAHVLAVTALPLQTATPLPATAITGLSATLNGSVNANEQCHHGGV